ILTERRADLDAGAALLLERETITPDDFAPLRRAEGKGGRGGAELSGRHDRVAK
ncbi:MAG: hypothetical protein H5U18_15920, partial [Rhodobacteraceae bacterium]|nr:hypothetical protein [Paracoccaceae bacterium]